MEAHGGRLAVEVLQRTRRRRHVHAVGRAPLRAVRRLPCRPASGSSTSRHEQTATFAAEGWAKVTRRLGCAALTAGPGVTNGVSALDGGADERLAARRARRARTAGTLGRGLVAGARPRPDRRAGDEDGRDRRRRRPRSSPRSTPRAAPRARRTAGRPSSTSRSTRSGPDRSTCRWWTTPTRTGVRSVDPDAVARSRRAARRRPSDRCSLPAATSSGRSAEDALRAFVEAAGSRCS